MNFKVETWERPPDAVRAAVRDGLTDAIEIGPLDWHGQKTTVSVRLLRLVSGEAMPFFHPHASGVNFVRLQIGPGTPLVINDMRALRSCVKALTESHRFYFARPFIVGDHLALTSSNASIKWFKVTREEGFRSPRSVEEVAFSTPFDAFTEPSASVFDWLARQYRDEGSEARFALAWMNKSRQQRDAYLEQTVPRLGELRELMRCIACVCELSPRVSWILQRPNSPSAPVLPAQLAPWSAFLVEHFFPFEPMTIDAPQCLREFLKWQSDHAGVDGETRTAHEQLEARFYLRDWLRNNAPDQMHLVQ